MLEIALEAARRGGEELLRYWGKLERFEVKGSPSDLVTLADQASEKTIFSYLREHTPDYALIG